MLFYYDKYMQKLLSYNAPLSICIGGNSIGKTYGFTKQIIDDYFNTGGLFKGKQFGWIRRYDTELKKAAANFFDDIVEHDEYPGYLFKTDSAAAYIAAKPKSEDEKPKWDTIGHFFALSKQGNYKGTAYPRVKRLVFDEYIRELKTPPGYLYDDIGKLMKLWKTVARKRSDCQLYLLSNAVDLVNPAFAWLGIVNEPKEGFSWHNNKTVILHHIKDKAFAASERDTLVGQVIAGTSLESVMIDNEFAQSNDSFIGDKTSKASYRYGFQYDKQRFGVWYDGYQGIFYINRKIPKGGQVYALKLADHAPNLHLISTAGQFARKMGVLYGNGIVYFSDNATRENFIKMLNMLGLK